MLGITLQHISVYIKKIDRLLSDSCEERFLRSVDFTHIFLFKTLITLFFAHLRPETIKLVRPLLLNTVLMPLAIALVPEL